MKSATGGVSARVAVESMSSTEFFLFTSLVPNVIPEETAPLSYALDSKQQKFTLSIPQPDVKKSTT